MLSLPSRSLLSAFRPSLFSSVLRGTSRLTALSTCGPVALQQARHRSQLAPRNMKYMKRHKGTIPVPTGGSTKGTTLAFGEFGIRIKGNGVRLSAKQLTTAEEVIKRKIKVIKGARVWLRVFPDIPVCIKVCRSHFEVGLLLNIYLTSQGNETRMGKGKGTFEFWATRFVATLLYMCCFQVLTCVSSSP
jgi:ribosomal protein L16